MRSVTEGVAAKADIVRPLAQREPRSVGDRCGRRCGHRRRQAAAVGRSEPMLLAGRRFGVFVPFALSGPSMHEESFEDVLPPSRKSWRRVRLLSFRPAAGRSRFWMQGPLLRRTIRSSPLNDERGSPWTCWIGRPNGSGTRPGTIAATDRLAAPRQRSASGVGEVGRFRRRGGGFLSAAT